MSQPKQALMSEVFAKIPSAIIVINEQGIITKANSSALALLGESSLEGRRWVEVISLVFRPRNDDGHEISTRDGRRLQVATLPLQQGQLIQMTDLTETRLLQDKLAHMERLSSLGRMAASLAHQIRTPLSAAILYAANLGNANLQPQARKRFQEKLMSRLEALEAQVSDILMFARSNEQTVSELNASDLIIATANNVTAILTKGNAELETINLDTPVPIMGNSTALTGALSNLIANAVEAGAHHVILKLSSANDKVYFAVANDGPPIPEELRAKIFEPFFTSKSSGTGLGLAVVTAVTKVHQGVLTLDSWDERFATVFTIAIPLYHQDPNAAHLSVRSPSVTAVAVTGALGAQSEEEALSAAVAAAAAAGAAAASAASAAASATAPASAAASATAPASAAASASNSLNTPGITASGSTTWPRTAAITSVTGDAAVSAASSSLMMDYGKGILGSVSSDDAALLPPAAWSQTSVPPFTGSQTGMPPAAGSQTVVPPLAGSQAAVPPSPAPSAAASAPVNYPGVSTTALGLGSIEGDELSGLSYPSAYAQAVHPRPVAPTPSYKKAKFFNKKAAAADANSRDNLDYEGTAAYGVSASYMANSNPPHNSFGPSSNANVSAPGAGAHTASAYVYSSYDANPSSSASSSASFNAQAHPSPYVSSDMSKISKQEAHAANSATSEALAAYVRRQQAARQAHQEATQVMAQSGVDLNALKSSSSKTMRAQAQAYASIAKSTTNQVNLDPSAIAPAMVDWSNQAGSTRTNVAAPETNTAALNSEARALYREPMEPSEPMVPREAIVPREPMEPRPLSEWSHIGTRDDLLSSAPNSANAADNASVAGSSVHAAGKANAIDRPQDFPHDLSWEGADHVLPASEQEQAQALSTALAQGQNAGPSPEPGLGYAVGEIGAVPGMPGLAGGAVLPGVASETGIAGAAGGTVIAGTASGTVRPGLSGRPGAVVPGISADFPVELPRSDHGEFDVAMGSGTDSAFPQMHPQSSLDSNAQMGANPNSLVSSAPVMPLVSGDAQAKDTAMGAAATQGTAVDQHFTQVEVAIANPHTIWSAREQEDSMAKEQETAAEASNEFNQANASSEDLATHHGLRADEL